MLTTRIIPCLDVRDGRVVKGTGDGLLAEFASAVDAVECAAEIQRAMPDLEKDVPSERRIQFRIGINVGDIVAAEDGDIYGDGVNVAARIESLAEPGGVFLRSEDDVEELLHGIRLHVGDELLGQLLVVVHVHLADLHLAVEVRRQFLDDRPDRHLDTGEQLLGRHRHEVSSRVSDDLDTGLIAIGDNGQFRIGIDNKRCVHLSLIDHTGQRCLGKAGTNVGGDIVHRNRIFKRALAAVRQGDNGHELSFCQWWPLLKAT